MSKTTNKNGKSIKGGKRKAIAKPLVIPPSPQTAAARRWWEGPQYRRQVVPVWFSPKGSNELLAWAVLIVTDCPGVPEPVPCGVLAMVNATGDGAFAHSVAMEVAADPDRLDAAGDGTTDLRDRPPIMLPRDVEPAKLPPQPRPEAEASDSYWALFDFLVRTSHLIARHNIADSLRVFLDACRGGGREVGPSSGYWPPAALLAHGKAAIDALPASEQRRIWCGWEAPPVPSHDEMVDFRKAIDGQTPTPVMVLSNNRRQHLSAEMEMLPLSDIAPVRVLIQPGTERDDALVSLGFLVSLIRDCFDELAADPSEAEEAVRRWKQETAAEVHAAEGKSAVPAGRGGR